MKNISFYLRLKITARHHFIYIQSLYSLYNMKIERVIHEAEINQISGFNLIGKTRDHEVVIDETVEFGGKDKGLSPPDLLLLAAMSCQVSSLSFCLSKRSIEHKLEAKGILTIERNEEGRLRVSKIDIFINVQADLEKRKYIESCIERFRNYCVVAGSIERSIPINTEVEIQEVE